MMLSVKCFSASPKNIDRSRNCLTLYHTIPTVNDPEKEAFENIVGKGENAGNQHFLLFPLCFLPFLKQITISEPHLFRRLRFFLI